MAVADWRWTFTFPLKPSRSKLLSVCSVLFNFLGRDFFNALSEKDVDRFYQMLAKWIGMPLTRWWGRSLAGDTFKNISVRLQSESSRKRLVTL